MYVTSNPIKEIFITETILDLPEPYQNAHVAAFSEAGANVYVLIGELIHFTSLERDVQYEWLKGEGLSVTLEEEILPLYTFFQTARTEEHAEEWLEWAGAPTGLLKALVKNGTLVRINSTTSVAAAKSLKGLRLSAQSLPGETRLNGYMGLKPIDSEDSVLTVSPELATLL